MLLLIVGRTEYDRDKELGVNLIETKSLEQSAKATLDYKNESLPPTNRPPHHTSSALCNGSGMQTFVKQGDSFIRLAHSSVGTSKPTKMILSKARQTDKAGPS